MTLALARNPGGQKEDGSPTHLTVLGEKNGHPGIPHPASVQSRSKPRALTASRPAPETPCRALPTEGDPPSPECLEMRVMVQEDKGSVRPCPCSAVPRTAMAGQYYWYDERGKKVKCTAPQYVDFVMSSVQKLVTDEDVFPTKYGREFPSSFESLVRKICRHLFHVLAHIYWAHFKETLALELHGHLNTLYIHFILFAREFNLLDPKETAVMDDLTEVLCSGAGGVHSGAGGDGAGSGGPGAQNHVKER
nr:MOB kinase activator 2 isoform X3 [Aotus nancymaae]